MNCFQRINSSNKTQKKQKLQNSCLKTLEMRCCVPFCKTIAESEDITFHRFPREVHLRAAWLRALGKQDALVPAGAVVCSQHFLDDEILETESGSRQIRTGAVPATVLICLICLDSRKKLLLMSEHKLEQAYQHLVGHPPCGGGRLKRTLCVQCAQRVVDFSRFRDESLRAHCLMTELLHTHEVITRRHVASLSRYKHPPRSDIESDRCDADTALDATATVAAATATAASDVAVAVKREVEHREEAGTYNADSIATAARALREHDYCEAPEDTPAAPETRTPVKREPTSEPESSEDRNQASVAPVVLATNPGNEEHPTDSSDDWDILSFEKNANVLTDPRKSQDTELMPKESSAKISDSVDDRFKSDPSQSRFGAQLRNHTDRIQYICDVCQKIFQRKCALVSHIRVHTFRKTLPSKLREYKLNQNHMLRSPKATRTEESFACELCEYKCTYNSHLVQHMRTHTGEKPFACKLCKYKCARNSSLAIHMRTHTGEDPRIEIRASRSWCTDVLIAVALVLLTCYACKMANCKKCKTFLSKDKDDVIKCKGSCGSYFHKKCAKKVQMENGRCEECRESSMVNTDSVPLNAESALAEINKKLEIIYNMQKTLDDLAESVDFYAEKYQELIQKQEKTEKKLTAVEQKNIYLEKYTKSLEERIVVLEAKEYENKVEIAGLEKLEGENIEKIVLNIAKKLDLDFESIESAQRVDSKQNNTQPNPVIVTLKSKTARNQWIIQRKNRISNNDIYNNGSNKPVYINEVLPKSVRQLLWITKKELKGVYKYIWVQNGKILVRKGDSERKISTVRSEDFLNKLKNDN